MTGLGHKFTALHKVQIELPGDRSRWRLLRSKNKGNQEGVLVHGALPRRSAHARFSARQKSDGLHNIL
jgi:hypothetical protein